MKLTKNQLAIIACIKANGRVYISSRASAAIFRQHQRLVDKGILTYTIELRSDGTGVWFDLV